MDRVVSEPELDGLAVNDSLLITGPPMTGKYDLFRSVLVGYSDAIITKQRATNVREEILSVTDDLFDERIGVIDCVSQEDGTEADDVVTKFVGSPRNLTGIGVGFTEVFDEFLDQFEGDRLAVGLHSASQLVMNADVKRVYQFMQVLTGQVRSAGCLGVAVLDAGAGASEDVAILQHHFDGMLETRNRDSGPREYRIRGLKPTTSEWSPF